MLQRKKKIKISSYKLFEYIRNKKPARVWLLDKGVVVRGLFQEDRDIARELNWFFFFTEEEMGQYTHVRTDFSEGSYGVLIQIKSDKLYGLLAN